MTGIGNVLSGSRGALGTERQSLEIAIVSPLPHQRFERLPARPIRFAEIPADLFRTFVVEIAGRAFALELREIESRAAQRLHPLFLSLGARLHGLEPALQRFTNDVCDVIALPAELLGGRRVETALQRSEEHTSELQSLMRISSAVLC